MYNMEAFHPARFTSRGSITLRSGEALQYETVCEDNVFYSEQGEPAATIFTYSYFRADIDEAARRSRPVLFIFNGGPGASSMMVHAGCFGTKRVRYPEPAQSCSPLPPYELIDNPDCLLDTADLVLVDPISTGYGLLLDENSASRFYGIDEDAEALVMFICRWLDRYQRWNSPKYLVGESYGCTRAAVAAAVGCGGGRERNYGLTFDGLVFIGNTVTVAKYFNMGAPVEPAVELLPTCAAIHWYHSRPVSRTIDDFVAEAAQFAGTEYLPALFKGEELTGKDREDIKTKLRYYCGVSDEYLEAHDLKLERVSFCRELLKADRQVVSIVDGRFTRPVFKPEYKEGQSGYYTDAASMRYTPVYRAALGEINRLLGIRDFDRSFAPSVDLGTELVPGAKWNFYSPQVSGERLQFAMHCVPGMRVLFANGYVDLVTQNGLIYHSKSHLNLPKDRVFIRHYLSGHMAYLGEDNCRAVQEDIRNFIAVSLI